MKVLVTGASGFVGNTFCAALSRAGREVTAGLRQAPSAAMVWRPAPDLGPDADWTAALAGQDAVVHLAARAHVMAETEADPLTLFRRVNRDGTLRLAEQAATAGIRRFIFVSSIKVNGEATRPGQPFRADDAPAPLDPYGVSKAEAEAGLAGLAARTGLELVVIRPPLIHGPGVKGNLATLMKAVARGLPLPLGCIDNRRALLGVDNLADLIGLCLTHPGAPGGTFLARDDREVSSPDLVRLMGAAMNRSARILPVPAAILRLGCGLLGRATAFDRLAGWLQVDDGPTRQRLGWTPPLTLEAGLAVMAAGRR